MTNNSISVNLVEDHYTAEDGLGGRLVAALEKAGLDLDNLTPRDLAPIDQLHTRGWPATVEHAEEFGFTSDMRVVDVGCGIGGPARYIARQFGCHVTGVDLTAEYIRAAEILTAGMGLLDQMDFQCANALALRFADKSFDAVWSQNVSMNIPDSLALYHEFHRVLKPDGKAFMAEMAQGPGGAAFSRALGAQARDQFSPDPRRNATKGLAGRVRHCQLYR